MAEADEVPELMQRHREDIDCTGAGDRGAPAMVDSIE
jgi:hypothetical protein